MALTYNNSQQKTNQISSGPVVDAILKIVGIIVEAHGGRLYAYNNSNDKGATFTNVLPLFRQQQK